MIQGKDGHQVEEHEGRKCRRRPDEEPPWVLGEHAHRGDGLALVALERLLEIGGLMDIEPDPEADENEQGTCDEGDTPSKTKELSLIEEEVDQDEGARRKDEAERCAELGEHPVPSALAGRCVFSGEEDRAAPFAAEAKPLPKAAEREKDGGGDADRRIGGKEADHDGRDAHREKRRDQRDFATEAIAEMPEERRSDGAREEGEGEGRERLEDGGACLGFREEEGREDEDRCGRVDIEIEELDGRADEAREQNAASVGRSGLDAGGLGHDELGVSRVRAGCRAIRIHNRGCALRGYFLSGSNATLKRIAHDFDSPRAISQSSRRRGGALRANLDCSNDRSR